MNAGNRAKIALLFPRAPNPDALPAGVYVIHRGRFIYVNEFFCWLTGFPKRELLAWGPGRWLALVAPVHRPAVLERLRAWRRGEAPPREYELYIRDRKGLDYAVTVFEAAFSLAGGPAVMGLVVYDEGRRVPPVWR